MTRVLVVAGSAVVRAGLESILLHEGGGSRFTLVGGTGPTSTVAEQVEELEPDVVLLELAAPDEPLAVTAERGVPPAIVVLGDIVSDGDWLMEALRRGVHALLPRDASAAEIVAAVSAAAAGLVTLHPIAVDALAAMRTDVASHAALPGVERGGAHPGAGAGAGGPDLTPREREVLRMLSEGLANKQIAARLAISEHTVKFHIASVYEKLGATSRTEAVRIGVRRGLVVL